MEQFMFWLVLLIILLGIEAYTLGLTTIWFAGGALAAIISSGFGAPASVQIVLFFAISVILLAFTRPVALKYFNKGIVKTNIESIIGSQCLITEEVNNRQGKGKAVLNGQEWSARAVSKSSVIPTGTLVTISSINGVKLIVDEIPPAFNESLQKMQGDFQENNITE